jgi:hypothetical protein
MIRIESCQHCYRDIRPAVIDPDGDVELWEDPNGMTVCKKKADGEEFLLHKPLPVASESAPGGDQR